MEKIGCIKIGDLTYVNKFNEIPIAVIGSLFKLFSEEIGIQVNPINLIQKKTLLEEFNFFIILMLASGKLEIEKKQINKFILLYKDYMRENKVFFKQSDILFENVVEKLFSREDLKDNSNLEIKNFMHKFQAAYFLMKSVFEGKSRETNCGDKQRYFEHLKGVTEIILNEIPSANPNRVLISLLHDVIEDIPGFSYETILVIFGKEIADGVRNLSKKPLELYLDEDEKSFYLGFLEKGFIKDRDEYLIDNFDKVCLTQNCLLERLIELKEIRRNDYFGHLDSLDDDSLAVKIADRIHNLRTLKGCGQEKGIRKINETKKYFLKVTNKWNIEVYKLLVDSLNNAIIEMGINEELLKY